MVDAAVARNVDKVTALARAHIRVLDEIVDGVKAYQSKMSG